MSNFKDVYDVSVAGFQSAIIEAQARFQQATLAGDLNAQVAASQELAGLRSTLKEYHQMATEHAASLQPAVPQNRYGLNKDEVDVARASRSDLPADQAEAEYARQKAKYQHMRATGQYRDDQGTVKR